MAFVEPVTLRGRHVWLEPLTETHLDALNAAAADGELWDLWYTSVPTPDEAAANMAFRLGERARGTMMPLVIRRAADDRVVGATTFCNIDSKVKRLEIGYTWYAKSVQRTVLNTEVKLMMLTHAFEMLGAKLVGWRTDNFNFASQQAIERLGARKDGVLRHHALRRDGTVRDTVMYSLTAGEWPEARAQLHDRLGQAARQRELTRDKEQAPC